MLLWNKSFIDVLFEDSEPFVLFIANEQLNNIFKALHFFQVEDILLGNLKASSQKYLRTFSGIFYCAFRSLRYSRSSSATKWCRISCLQEVMRIFLERIMLLISVKKCSQVTSVSRIFVPANFFSSSASRTCS